MNFDNIPHEMRQYNQWIVWRYEPTDTGEITKIPYSCRTGRKASVTDPSTWSTFAEVCEAYHNNPGAYAGIGFVLTDKDPFCFIDLDNAYASKADGSAKFKEPHKIRARQEAIFRAFNSYSEKSPSGNGLHIIVKGSVPAGRKRSAVEVYSRDRYMTMTGDVYLNAPIEERQELVSGLWDEMGMASNMLSLHDGTAAAMYDDHVLINMATSAINGDKFERLFKGQWQDLYASQSEADFALIDILSFYSKNAAQVIRLFQQSGLGQRQKAYRPDYLEKMLRRAWDNQPPEVDIEGLKEIAEQIAANKGTIAPDYSSQQSPVNLNEMLPPSFVSNIPDGLIRHLAYFIYQTSPRPVEEISLAAAIAFMSGVAGRCYNVSGTGLNQYMALLAHTGMGKEAIAKGVNRLTAEMRNSDLKAVDEFIGPAVIASGQALFKYLEKTRSFVSIIGEFGLFMQQLSGRQANGAQLALRQFILDLYNKSGRSDMVRPMIYADKDKNTDIIYNPAVSILGESTPERFWEAVDEDLIAEGLLPRFLLFHYNGRRPPLNTGHASAEMPEWLRLHTAQFVGMCLELNGKNRIIDVQHDESAKVFLDDFNVFCDAQINDAGRDVNRQLWNRAHLKATKLAALFAVSVNPMMPTITLDQAQWAKSVVVADIQTILRRFEIGAVGVIGTDERKQMEDAYRIMKDYLQFPWEKVKPYTGYRSMHETRVIPYEYIQRRCANMSAFKKDKIGATAAIKRTIKTLIEMGDVVSVQKSELMKRYEYNGEAYMITKFIP